MSSQKLNINNWHKRSLGNMDYCETAGSGYNIFVNIEPKTHERKDEGLYQKIQPDFTVRIPTEVVKKLNWGIGSEVWIDVHDEELSQAIIGKRLRGEEARKAIEKLERIISGD